MGTSPSHFKGAKNPVEQVNSNDVMAFCKKLSLKTGKNFTLPSEAQWEYACRAGSTGRFCFGDSDSGLGDYAWYSVNSGRQTHPVGQKKPNEWGLYDMHGNVWEWCLDRYDDRFYEKQVARERNPVNSNQGDYRVLRGGSWTTNPSYCRSANRHGVEPWSRGYRYGGGGFRVVSFSL